MTFLQFAASFGLIIDQLEEGRWVRVKTQDKMAKRNGSYKFVGTAGFVQNHATMLEVATWFPNREEKTPVVDRAAVQKRLSDERRALVKATHAARTFFLACMPLNASHPYLKAHGLSMAGCFGLRIDSDGWIVVPALKDGNLMSVQRIAPAGDKLFWKGASIKGAAYTVERPGAMLTILCEGLATGLALFDAVKQARVVVGFSAGNFANLGGVRGLCVVAADNDHATEARIGTNPGRKAAEEAASRLGCGVVIPVDMAGSDWADWRQERLLSRPGRKFGGVADKQREVDAEIAGLIMRAARFVRSNA